MDPLSAQDPDFGGMTVNERLVIAGLLDEFDAAIDAADRLRAINVLKRATVEQWNNPPSRAVTTGTRKC